MDSVKYIGLDVHRDTISVAVLDQNGRLVMQSVIPTRASAILDCVGGIQGSLPGATAHGRVDRTSENTPPFPQQTPVLGLLRTSAGDSRQRRILRGQRAGGTQKEAGIGARIELEP
jgi:hypothetical protein